MFNTCKQKKNDAVDDKYINELKEFFFFHNGDSMSMWRESTEKYHSFREICDDTVEAWRQELINEKFKLFSAKNREDCWVTVGILIHRIASSKTLVESNYKRLLEQICDIAPFLDKRQKILILEYFAGTSYSQEDGGIYYIQTKTNLFDKLMKTIDILSDFTCDSSDDTDEIGWENMQGRFDNAKKNVKNALCKFKKTSPTHGCESDLFYILENIFVIV